MIDLIAAALGFGAIGYAAGAVMTKRTLGKVADLRSDEVLVDYFDAEYERAAHDRCADALETARNRIEYALEQVTPGSNATVKRIARILRGEQG